MSATAHLSEWGTQKSLCMSPKQPHSDERNKFSVAEIYATKMLRTILRGQEHILVLFTRSLIL